MYTIIDQSFNSSDNFKTTLMKKGRAFQNIGKVYFHDRENGPAVEWGGGGVSCGLEQKNGRGNWGDSTKVYRKNVNVVVCPRKNPSTSRSLCFVVS